MIHTVDPDFDEAEFWAEVRRRQIWERTSWFNIHPKVHIAQLDMYKLERQIHDTDIAGYHKRRGLAEDEECGACPQGLERLRANLAKMLDEPDG